MGTLSRWINEFGAQEDLINISWVPTHTPSLCSFFLIPLFQSCHVVKLPGCHFKQVYMVVYLSLPKITFCLFMVCPSSSLIYTHIFHEGRYLVWFFWILNGSHNAWHIVGAQSIFTEWINDYLIVDNLWKDGDMNMCASHPHPVPRPNQQNWAKSVKIGRHLYQF